MGKLTEAISRFRALTEDNIARAGKAAEKLRHKLGTPTWLAGVGVALDPGRSRAAIQVSVKPGYYPSALPSHVDGIPVVTTQTKLTGTLPF